MSRKHRLIGSAIAVAITATGMTSAYATKVRLESEYSKINLEQQAEFKKQLDILQKELKNTTNTINTNNKNMNIMQKQIDELKNNIDQKDQMIKNLSSNYGAKFNPENVGEVSGVTKVTMRRILKGTDMSTYADHIVDAERTFGVNAIFLASVFAFESWWGKSDPAKYQNNPSGTYINGVLHTFPTLRDGIMFTAENIAKNYLSPKGEFYNGTSVSAVNTRYCINKDSSPYYPWTTNVTLISRGLVKKGGTPPTKIN